MRFSHETYDKVFGAIYLGMLANLLLAIACAPLLVVAFTTSPSRTWPALAVMAPLCAPALIGAFAMFTHFSDDGPVDLVRTFAHAWRRSLRRALTLGAVASLTVVILSVDVTAAGRSHSFAIVIPLLLMLDVLVVATMLVTLVGMAEQPTARIRDIARPAVYLAVRRWYLTAFSLLVTGVLGSVVATRPIIGFGVIAAPMMYIVWANSRFTLQPILHSNAPTDA